MSTPSSTSPDLLILTVGNENQAAGFRAQLELRRRRAQLPDCLETHVVADPPSMRAGSGGSTLLVFQHLDRILSQGGSLAEKLAARRIVLVHAGGLSTRVPAYAALGKLFTPLPCLLPMGQPAALFDLLLRNLLHIPRPTGGHVLIASGDVLLTFDPTEIDLERPGVTGICYPESIDRASRHGVYVTTANGTVRRFLQKPGPETLATHRAIDASGRALIDTGLMSWSPEAVEAVCQAAAIKLANGKGLLERIASGEIGEIDLYEEIAIGLAAETTAAEFDRQVLSLPRNAHPVKQALLKELYATIHAQGFHAVQLSGCDFFHVGTSRQLLSGLTQSGPTTTTYSFHNCVQAIVPKLLADNRAVVFNSIVQTEELHLGPGSVIEGSHVQSALVLKGNNLVTGIPECARLAIHLPADTGLLMLPVGKADNWAAVIYGLDDDFQSPRGQDGCTFLNRPVTEFLMRRRIAPEVLWPAGPETLYFAKLWIPGSAEQTWQSIGWILQANAAAAESDSWAGGQRLSLADLLREVDYQRLLAERSKVERQLRLGHLFDWLRACADFDSGILVDQVEDKSAAAKLMIDLSEGMRSATDPLLCARASILGKLLVERFRSLPADETSSRRFEQAAWAIVEQVPTDEAFARKAQASVQETVARHVALPGGEARAAIAVDQVVWATAPARLDFAGGWSDTPPICTERGGTVVNAAVTLNGQYPTQAIVKLNEELRLSLTSIDLGQRLVIERIEELRAYADPADWASLPKACCCMAGLVGTQCHGDLRPILRSFGGGLDVTLFSALPKGSGLGTSSILGAALLSALARLTGATLTLEQLIGRTALLEQWMTTGGGWQDQVGGVLPGIKLIRTEPGWEQVPAVLDLAADASLFGSRMLLYYTGYKRLAKNILKNVVERYLARDPQTLISIERLKAGALDLRTSIAARDLDGFGNGLADYWELKKRIDPGSSNADLETLIARVRSRCAGSTLLGAGGGGFLLMLARSDDDARSIRQELTAVPSAPGARFFDFDVDRHGLRVSIL